MALVNKAASESYLSELQVAFEQEFLCSFDPPAHQPMVWRHTDGLPKGAGKMAGGQAAFSRQIGDRRIGVEMSFDESAGTPKLPARAPRGWSYRPQARRHRRA